VRFLCHEDAVRPDRWHPAARRSGWLIEKAIPLHSQLREDGSESDDFSSDMEGRPLAIAVSFNAADARCGNFQYACCSRPQAHANIEFLGKSRIAVDLFTTDKLGLRCERCLGRFTFSIQQWAQRRNLRSPFSRAGQWWREARFTCIQATPTALRRTALHGWAGGLPSGQTWKSTSSHPPCFYQRPRPKAFLVPRPCGANGALLNCPTASALCRVF